MTGDTSATVELWVRSFAPTTTGPKHERAIERLDRLEGHPSVDSVSVRVWGRTFERTERTRRVPHLEGIAQRLERFEEWAERTGRSLEPFFRTHHVESKITGDAADVCRLPTLALAEYREDELVHLAPSSEGERTVTVTERLEALLGGEGQPDPGSILEFDGNTDEESNERRRLEHSR